MAESLFGRLKAGLTKTRQGFVDKIEQLIKRSGALDDDFYDELEAILISGDVGARTASGIVTGVRNSARKSGLKTPDDVKVALKGELARIVGKGVAVDVPEVVAKPLVILVVGVNGVGKTTTIGKLAGRYREEGKKVLVAAGDTFRAAAIDQLEIWADRAGVTLIKRPEGSDPASVAFEAVSAAKSDGSDVVIIDTAGRLHTKVNLMEELKKIRRVVSRELVGAPHETLLVLDATMGQNAIVQAKVFLETVAVTSIVLTKLDGTAKGGVVIGICDELKIPIRFIGVGEQIDDLRDFDPAEFVEALFG